MSAMPEIPELKDSDFGWECPTCRTKIGKDFRPLSNCACGQPWIVLDAEGQRTTETFRVSVVSRSELPAVLYCSICGTVGGFHKRDCAFWEQPQPPVYDLAEFERNLEDGISDAVRLGNRDCILAIQITLKALRSSKRP